MVLFPLRHDRLDLRRWPWVTLAILLLNLAVAGLQLLASLGPPIAAADDAVVAAWLARAPLDQTAAIAPDGSVPASFAWMLHWGLSRAVPAAHAWISYGFVHGGLFHLVSNLWFLWLTAPLAEDRWGHGPFAWVYLSALPIAAMPAFLEGSGGVPLVGASGAVAAFMAVFLVHHARARMEFFYILPPIVILFRMPMWGRFTAPAWLMIGMWFIGELLSTDLSDGVAHSAHVGGFVWGLVAAVVLAALGVDGGRPRPRRGARSGGIVSARRGGAAR